MGDDFELSLDKVWSDIEPLYQELHAYVRFKISKTHKLKKDACIPANLMGDMFAQNWENIFHLVGTFYRSSSSVISSPSLSNRHHIF